MRPVLGVVKCLVQENSREQCCDKALRATKAAQTKQMSDELVLKINRENPWKFGKGAKLNSLLYSLLHSPHTPPQPSWSLMSYHCFFPGRWHLVPATLGTVVAGPLEPSSIRSKRGRSCERQHHGYTKGQP